VKTRVYLRVAKGHNGRTKFAATAKPVTAPLYDSNNRPLPTVAFGISLDIPEVRFHQAAQIIAEVLVAEDDAVVAAEVVERET
jgi:hypothetical protein